MHPVFSIQRSFKLVISWRLITNPICKNGTLNLVSSWWKPSQNITSLSPLQVGMWIEYDNIKQKVEINPIQLMRTDYRPWVNDKPTLCNSSTAWSSCMLDPLFSWWVHGVKFLAENEQSLV